MNHFAEKKESKCDIPEIILSVQCASLAINGHNGLRHRSRIHLAVQKRSTEYQLCITVNKIMSLN